MTYILNIETATKNCSVALSANGEIVALREDIDKGYNHAALLTVLIDELMKSQKLDYDKLSAVCVNKGPGSYTGLRIGVSAAKGICFAKDIPLIGVDSLYSLAQQCLDTRLDIINSKVKDGLFYLCPMIDARRMEVYSAVYDEKLKLIEPINAVIVENDSFKKRIEERPFFIFGDGAEKCVDSLKHSNLFFIPEIMGSARGMIKEAYNKYLSGEFENLAYFEPFYLKDFVAGKPSVKGLQ
ncbi:MAG: tRNA (adenosine(37)-N6)-threonylcarbamoyltransferase complex dimerization subunit type 1 TsaB [Bacteroidetes bacterium]|nr:tRNA (adenosine(37)-N6)-threonylcarbamoyltransferase complex dimerization subunit type 1 TsaB [Bacteroidota bacterium]